MRDTTNDPGDAQVINSSGMNNLAAGDGLAYLIVGGLALGAVQMFRRLKAMAASKR